MAEAATRYKMSAVQEGNKRTNEAKAKMPVAKNRRV